MLVGVAPNIDSDSREFWEATPLEATRRWLFCYKDQRLSADSEVDSRVESGVHPVAAGTANRITISLA